MKRKTVLAAGLVVALAGVAAIPALSHGAGEGWGHMQGYGPGAMMGQDGDEGGPGFGMGGAMQGHGPDAMMGQRGGPEGMGGFGGGARMHGAMEEMMGQMMAMHGGGLGPMGRPDMMGAFVSKFDTNHDGTVSPDEMRAGLQAALKQYEKNGDGTLSLDEFAGFYADITRTAMVRHFQALDLNGDGKVTADEIVAPADRMDQMQSLWHAHHGAGTAIPAPGSQSEDK